VKALVITRYDGPEALELQQVPEPTPKPAETVVKVEAGGLNFADILTLQGGYPGTPQPPLIAGREFAGVDERSGKRVMGYTQWAGFAEQTTARPALLWPVPRGWTAEKAAAFPVNYFTAYFAYWKAGFMDKPATAPRHSDSPSPPRVLIHAVAGGVGTAGVEIGKILGAEVYGTSSSDEKLKRVKELGLKHGINYKQQDYEQAIKDLTQGEGVDAVFEMLGGEHTAKSARCLRDFGRVIVYGSATGKPPILDTRLLYAKGSSVHGLWLTYLSAKSDLMAEAWNHLSTWVEQGKLNPVLGHTFSIDQAPEAYRLLMLGKNFGKVVLKLT
jgi:NADPH:quinone reductase-like Zn-dependent oxidoreductase